MLQPRNTDYEPGDRFWFALRRHPNCLGCVAFFFVIWILYIFGIVPEKVDPSAPEEIEKNYAKDLEPVLARIESGWKIKQGEEQEFSGRILGVFRHKQHEPHLPRRIEKKKWESLFGSNDRNSDDIRMAAHFERRTLLLLWPAAREAYLYRVDKPEHIYFVVLSK